MTKIHLILSVVGIFHQGLDTVVVDNNICILLSRPILKANYAIYIDSSDTMKEG